MLIHNLQAKFILIIVTIVHKRVFLDILIFYTIHRSTTNIFNTGSLYVLILMYPNVWTAVLKMFVVLQLLNVVENVYTYDYVHSFFGEICNPLRYTVQ